MKERLLQAIANAFHPLFSMMWATVLLVYYTPLVHFTASAKWTLFIEVAIYTFALPLGLIFWLYKRKKIEDIALHNRYDRIIPLTAQVIFMIVLLLVLGSQGLDEWALRFYYGGLLLSIMALIISTQWKISGHAMGNAAITTAAFVLYMKFPVFMPYGLPILLLVLTGLVGSIRLYFGRHNLAQIAAGALVGSLCILIVAFV